MTRANPGAYHVMLANLKTALNVGGQVRQTLAVRTEGVVTVVAGVRGN